MRIDRYTLIGLSVALVVISGLAGWGHLLALDPAALGAVRTAASALAVVILASMRALLSSDKDGDGIPDVLQAPKAVILALALTAGMWAGTGCGASAGQVALSSQASIIVATQPARFDAYAILDEHCGPLPRPEYRACMMPARHVARASDSYREALQGAQALLNAGEGADVAPCVIAAAQAFLGAGRAARVPIPAEVHTFAAMIPAGECHAADQ